MHSQHCGYRCPGAKAPGHRYRQCWFNIHCIGPILYKNITLVLDNIRNWNYILKKWPSRLRAKWQRCIFCIILSNAGHTVQLSLMNDMCRTWLSAILYHLGGPDDMIQNNRRTTWHFDNWERDLRWVHSIISQINGFKFADTENDVLAYLQRNVYQSTRWLIAVCSGRIFETTRIHQAIFTNTSDLCSTQRVYMKSIVVWYVFVRFSWLSSTKPK